MKLLKEENESSRIKLLNQKISKLDDYAYKNGYDKVIVFEGIKDTVENHLNRYKEELASLYDSEEFFEEGESSLKESLVLRENTEEMEELYYPNLTITYVTNYIDPYDYDEREATIDYIYEIDRQSVEEVLFDLLANKENLYFDTDEEADSYMEANYEDLLERYHDEVLDYFRADALEQAEENYREEDYFPDDY